MMISDPPTSMTSFELYEFYFGKLKFCGCGNPELAMELLRDVLSIMETQNGSWDALKQRLHADADEGLYFTYLYWIDSVGLTEHGGNIMGSWLTDLGRRVLAGLKEHGTDPDGWDCE